MPILFDHNSVTGVSQYFDYDPAKDTYYLTSTQDISGMLDNIKKSRKKKPLKRVRDAPNRVRLTFFF